jgi:hypothetical protein
MDKRVAGTNMMESLQIQALLFTSSGNLGSGDAPVNRFNARRSIN